MFESTSPSDSPRQWSRMIAALTVIFAVAASGLVSGGMVAFAIARAIEWSRKPPDLIVEAASPEPPPIAVGWDDPKPDLVLVVTGEMQGYLRPCGCSLGQQGGLARRGGLLRYLREDRHWDILPIDLGDLVGRSTSFEADRYHYALDSLEKLGYAAISIGPNDLALSANTILGQAINLQSTKLVLANFGHADPDLRDLLAASIADMVIVERGGTRVGITSVVSERTADAGRDRSVRIEPAVPAAARLLAKMKAAGAELKVLLAGMPVEEADRLVAAVPGYDLVVCQSRVDDALTQDAHRVGDSLVTWVGRKGKSVGLVGYWKSAEPHVRMDIAPVDSRFQEDATLDRVYADLIQTIKEGKYVEKAAKLPLPVGEAFVGAERCGQCHKRAYATWSATRHAHALESLEKAKPPGQDFNPECVLCHTTGFDQQSGFVTRAKTPNLAGNQCENCHGPGRRHAEDEKNPQWIQPMKRSQNTVEQKCRVCHDADNSPRFRFDTYWEKVRHPFKD